MKWFQHDSDARQDPKLRLLVNGGGMAAYGAYWALSEYVAQAGEGDPGWAVQADGRALDPFDMAVECGQPDEDALVAFLDRLAALRLIDRDVWRERRIVFLPAMAKRADEYTKKKARRKPDEIQKTPDTSAVESGPGPDTPVDVTVDLGSDDLPRDQPLPIGGDDQVDALVRIWNTKAAKGLPRIAKVDDERRRTWRSALAKHPNLADWERAIVFLNGSDWWLGKLKGAGHDNWTGTLGYLAKPGKLQAALEKADAAKVRAGDGRTGSGAGPVNGSAEADEARRRGRVAPTPGKYANA